MWSLFLTLRDYCPNLKEIHGSSSSNWKGKLQSSSQEFFRHQYWVFSPIVVYFVNSAITFGHQPAVLLWPSWNGTLSISPAWQVRHILLATSNWYIVQVSSPTQDSLQASEHQNEMTASLERMDITWTGLLRLWQVVMLSISVLGTAVQVMAALAQTGLSISSHLIVRCCRW